MLLLLSTQVSLAADDERAAILALMDRAFAAIASGNPDNNRAVQLAEGTSISFRQDPDGEPGELVMRLTSNEALLADGSDGGEKYLERWTGDPTVMIRGPIAAVWGEYEFFINDDFSHCGVDAAQLVKVDGEWKIANWTWTVEKDGCDTAAATSM